jgi:hypothetical protein
MDRPQHPLRQEDGDQRRNDQHGEHGAGSTPHGLPQLPAHQQGVDPDPDFAERALVHEDGLANLERAIRIDGLELHQRAAALDDRAQILLVHHGRPFGRPEVMRDGPTFRIDDGRVRDVGIETGARFENRTDAAVLAQRPIRVVAARGDDLRGAQEDGSREQLPAHARFLEAASGHRREVIGAQYGHDHHHERRDAGNLFGFD